MARRHTSKRRSETSKSDVHEITGMFRMVKNPSYAKLLEV